MTHPPTGTPERLVEQHPDGSFELHLPALTGCPNHTRTGPGMQEDKAGPLVRQPAPAARLARILHNSAMDLWDICTYTDSAQMWEEARAIASRILACAPGA